MNKVNHDANLEKLINENIKNGVRPKLLLHACCAPCASSCIERLIGAFNVSVYFYNPNIDTINEFIYREKECQRLCAHFGVEFISAEHNKTDFLSAVVGLENEPERGKRCENCFSVRLNNAFNKAKEIGAEYFATTLTLSPLKNAELINKIGENFTNDVTKYLPTDFKKRGGYARSIELSKELGLYRQNYCGCEFSKRKEKMYKVYKFADIPFGVTFYGEYTLKKNAEYETEEKPLFDVSVNKEDIELERETYIKINNEDFKHPESILEHTAIYRKFVEKAVEYGVVLFHGSAIEYKGRAYLFVAPSGTGKSTHVKLITEVFGTSVSYINDDKPLLKLENGEIFVCGTPYNGKHNLSNNVKVPLGAICVLTRGKENVIERLDKSVSALQFLKFSYMPKDENASKLYFEIIERVLEYPVYKLACNMQLDAPKLSINTMSKDCE